MKFDVGRVNLSNRWIPKETKTLLDVGCSFGHGTNIFSKKSKKTYGIDPNKELIKIAKKNYPKINFQEGTMEKTKFPKEFFDTIIVNDVLEHTPNEINSLNEMYKILKPGGILIITTPHKGLFSFLDVDNYTYYMKKHLPKTYNKLYKAKTGKLPKYREGYTQKHKHYNLKNYKEMLRNTKFNKTSKILKVFRSGLIVGPLTNNLRLLFEILTTKKITNKIMIPFEFLKNKEFEIPFGPSAYNIAIKIKKNETK